MIEVGDYGPVRITGGRYRTRCGYYDDEGEKIGTAIVYMGKPGDGWKEIPLKYLEKYPENKVYLGNTLIKDATIEAISQKLTNMFERNCNHIEIVDQETGADYSAAKVVIHEGKVRLVISEKKD